MSTEETKGTTDTTNSTTDNNVATRENVVIKFGSLKEQIMSSHLLIKCDVTAYNKTLQQQNPVKGSVNFISALSWDLTC